MSALEQRYQAADSARPTAGRRDGGWSRATDGTLLEVSANQPLAHQAVLDALRPWLEASFVCLLVFATVHMAVRGISRMGFGQNSRSMLVRVAWASLFAIFPEAPIAWRITRSAVSSAAKAPSAKPEPTTRRQSRAQAAVGRLSRPLFAETRHAFSVLVYPLPGLDFCRGNGFN